MVTKAEKRAKRLKQRDENIKRQRQAAARRRRNKAIINYGIIAVIAVAALYGGFAYWQAANAPGEHDALAQCLTEKGVGMYGVDWCPHCQEQKRMFGNSFKYVTYINCDINPTACDNQGVTGYPTWIFPDGTRLSGEQDLEVLAENANCPVQ